MSSRKFLLPSAFCLLLFACASARPVNPIYREIDATIEQAIKDKKIPGGVYHFEQNGRIYEKVYGNRALVPDVEPMTVDTIFDAASLTKVVATTPSIWLLIERGKIGLDDPARWRHRGAHRHDRRPRGGALPPLRHTRGVAVVHGGGVAVDVDRRLARGAGQKSEGRGQK